jgi:hypothetical protein
MNKGQKDQIRLFILKQMYYGDLRSKLDEISRESNVHPFEAIDFYENEVERINKLFNYPGQ